MSCHRAQGLFFAAADSRPHLLKFTRNRTLLFTQASHTFFRPFNTHTRLPATRAFNLREHFHVKFILKNDVTNALKRVYCRKVLYASKSFDHVATFGHIPPAMLERSARWHRFRCELYGYDRPATPRGKSLAQWQKCKHYIRALFFATSRAISLFLGFAHRLQSALQCIS